MRRGMKKTMRKRLAALLAACAACAMSLAQEVMVSTVAEAPAEPTWDFEQSAWQRDSLHLPPLTADGRVMPISRFPFYHYGWAGMGTWDLHKGLNMSLSASVFAQFGKHAHHGAGFAQSLSAMYATPLTPKLSLAVGGYMNHVYWSHTPMRDAGLSAVLSYRFDEHWEAYLYGQKSLVSSNNIPWTLYDMGALGDRIGAAVRYNFNPSFSVEVSVEHGRRPQNDHPYLMRRP